MRLIHCLSWTKCWWAFWWTNCSHFLASSSNPGSPLSPSAHWHKTLSGQAWTRAGYRTEYYLVQKLPSTKYCIVVAALKYRILGSTKYFLTIVSTHCDCLVTIHLTTLKQFISGHLLFLKVSSERLGLGASFHRIGPSGPIRSSSRDVRVYVCCLSPSHAIFFEASHWPSGHMTRSRPLIGRPPLLFLKLKRVGQLKSGKS